MSGKPNLSYVETNGNYYVYSIVDAVEYTCVFTTGSSSGIDFNNNYRATAQNLG